MDFVFTFLAGAGVGVGVYVFRAKVWTAIKNAFRPKAASVSAPAGTATKQ
jgi:hypothetical protein